MSLENFNHWQKTGITGDDRSNCFVAAIDCISPNTDAPPDTYMLYDLLANEPNNSKSVRNIFRMVLEDLGVTSYKNFHEKNIRTPQEAEIVLHNAKIGGWRAVIWTEPEHVVGLLPSDNGWRMVGTGVPVNDPDRIFSSREIFDFIIQRAGRFRGKPTPNIYLIGPEKKHK